MTSPRDSGQVVACAAYAGGSRVADVALEDDIFNERISRDTTMRIYTLKRDLLEIKRGSRLSWTSATA
jgi:hypothetical protein